MNHTPFKATGIDKILKAVSGVRTKGALASVNLVMIAVVFTVLAIFGSSFTLYQVIVIIALFLCWQAFAIYALRQLPIYDQTRDISIKEDTTAVNTVKPKRLRKG